MFIIIILTILGVLVMIFRLYGIDGLWDASSRFRTFCLIMSFL